MDLIRAARLENNVVVDLWMVPNLTCFDGIELFEAPDDVMMGYTYSNGIWEAPPKTEEELRIIRIDEINSRLEQLKQDTNNLLPAITRALAKGQQPDFEIVAQIEDIEAEEIALKAELSTLI